MNAYQTITEDTLNKVGAALQEAQELIFDMTKRATLVYTHDNHMKTVRILQALDSYRAHKYLLQTRSPEC